jgi:hypothetical protein
VATLIRQLPFGEPRSHVEVGGRLVSVLPFQAVVWVSVAPKGPEPFDPRTPRIPAVVDLGFNGTFAIREEQLREWAGVDPRLFPRLRRTRLRGAPTDARLANLWLHPNVPRTRDPSGRAPFRLELFKGIFVLGPPERPGEEDHRPQLPLLGIYALHRANLKLIVDCGPCRLSIRTAPSFPFWG